MFNGLDIKLEEKFRFAFDLLDSEKSSSLSEEQLEKMLTLNFVPNPNEAKKKFRLIKEEIKKKILFDNKIYDFEILLGIFKQRPNYFYANRK